jgi:N-methylhydantoinase B
VLPDRVIAASGGTPAAMNVFYGKRNDGRPFHSVIIRGGGMGAGANADGPHVYIFPANGANTPVEIFESDTPLIVEERRIIADSGGPGKRRGGLGKMETFRIPDDQFAPSGPVNLGIQAGRFRYPAEGLSNGKRGMKAEFRVNGKSGNPYGLTRLNPGDVLTMGAAGGGGFGDPFTREPEAVLEDVMDGYVSIDVARRHYGVAINADTWQVDESATQVLRNSR